MKEIAELKKYPEFHALKVELDKFAASLTDISDIDITKPANVSLETQIAGRLYGAEKLKEFLYKIGILEKETKKRDLTFE